jgi:hypothetical protein
MISIPLLGFLATTQLLTLVHAFRYPISCFSCASEEYQPMYESSPTLQSIGQPGTSKLSNTWLTFLVMIYRKNCNKRPPLFLSHTLGDQGKNFQDFGLEK